MYKIINTKTDLYFSTHFLPCTINFESKPKQKHMLFVAIPMGVYAYQAADWSVDVRNSTIFGYVTKITLGSPREIIPFLDNYATCYRIR